MSLKREKACENRKSHKGLFLTDLIHSVMIQFQVFVIQSVSDGELRSVWGRMTEK